MTRVDAESSLADRYRLERRLASGGMGQVWLARDVLLDRDVAVKILAVGADGDLAAVERFRREARTMAALQHPNIVTVFDSGTHEGAAFIVMELLTGPTLAQLVADRGPLPEHEAVRLGVQIAAGLAAAHRAGVIHRDIKPSNLMFSSSGMLKVVDFGIARLWQTTASALTATNAVIGSAPYLSPEQASGGPADEQSDLYALGCVLTTMVTGLPPFTGEHPIGVLHQHVHNPPPQLGARQPGVSPALEALVGRLLDKRPDARPGSAEEVETQLTRILTAPDLAQPAPTATLVDAAGPRGHLPSGTATTQAFLPDARPAGAAHPGSRQVSAQPERTRPRPWWLVVAALISGAVLAAVAVAPLLNPPGQGTAAPPASATPPAPRASTSPSATAPTSKASVSPRTTPRFTTARPVPQTSTVPTTATTRTTPTPPRTNPQPSPSGRPAAPLARVRAAVRDAVAGGQMDPKKADEFSRRLDDLEKKLGEGRKDVGKRVDDLAKYLGQLVKKGELTAGAFRRIQAALSGV